MPFYGIDAVFHERRKTAYRLASGALFSLKPSRPIRLYPGMLVVLSYYSKCVTLSCSQRDQPNVSKITLRHETLRHERCRAAAGAVAATLVRSLAFHALTSFFAPLLTRLDRGSHVSSSVG